MSIIDKNYRYSYSQPRIKGSKTEIEKAAEAAAELEAKFAQIGESIKNSIVQNLTDAVMGTQTLAEAAINVLERMRRKLVELAIQKQLLVLVALLVDFSESFWSC